VRRLGAIDESLRAVSPLEDEAFPVSHLPAARAPVSPLSSRPGRASHRANVVGVARGANLLEEVPKTVHLGRVDDRREGPQLVDALFDRLGRRTSERRCDRICVTENELDRDESEG